MAGQLQQQEIEVGRRVGEDLDVEEGATGDEVT
jgi:hypothetical protein